MKFPSACSASHDRAIRALATLCAAVTACWCGAPAVADQNASADRCAASAGDPLAALRTLNALRLEPLACGAEVRPAAPPLRWSARLAEVAHGQAGAMATHRRLAHRDPSERPLTARLAEAGYPPRIAAENVAFGYDSVDAVVGAWRDSTAHCRNLMHPAVVEGALACVDRDGTRYWALVLGAPADRLPN